MRISVCMATFNGQAFIGKQLRSILSQLKINDEVIISDDSSSDDTLFIVNNFEDPRIKLFSNQNFRSPIKNFENALNQATGDIIFLADQDDLWLEDKVEKMCFYLKEYDLVLSDCYIVGSKGEILSRSFFLKNGSKPGLLKNLIKNSYLGCNMAFKKEILNKALPFPSKIPMHDWWIGLIGEMFYRVKHLNITLMNYRRHDNNASSTGERSKTNLWTKANYRISLVTGLVGRVMRK